MTSLEANFAAWNLHEFDASGARTHSVNKETRCVQQLHNEQWFAYS